MIVEFSIENRGDYLYLILKGDINTVEDVLRYGKAYREKSAELGIKRVLIDYRGVKKHLNYLSMLRLSEELQKSRFVYEQHRIAHLVSPEDVERFEEFKTPAVNRGFYFESFTDMDEALAYLLEG